MRMIIRCTMILIAVVAGQAAFSAPISLSLPELTWALEIAAPGFVIEDKEIAPNGDGARLQAKNKETGLILSAFLERAPQTGDSTQCRDYYWGKAKQSPLKKEQITLYETGGHSCCRIHDSGVSGNPRKTNQPKRLLGQG